MNNVLRPFVMVQTAGRDNRENLLKTLKRSTAMLFLALLMANHAYAMTIKAPDIAENGAVVPVEISLDRPMTAGQILELLVNGEPAAQVRLMEGKFSLFSTRVKGAQNNTTITARVIANGRELDSASRNVVVNVTKPVGGPPTSVGHMRVRTASGDLKMLMNSENGFAGTLVVQDAGFRAEISGSAVLTKNPFVGLKGEFSDQVSASIDGRTQQEVNARALEQEEVRKAEQDARETREAWGQLLGAIGQYQQNKADRRQAQQAQQQEQQRRMQDQQNSAYVAEAARAEAFNRESARATEARRKAHHPENVANNCVHVVVDKFNRQKFHNNCPWPVSIKWPAGIVDLNIGGGYPTMQDGPFSYFACKYDRNGGAGIGPGGNICTN